MVDVPGPTADTTPELETVAAAGFDVVHVKVVLLIKFPWASLATAVACDVCPIDNDSEAGVMAIDARG